MSAGVNASAAVVEVRGSRHDVDEAVTVLDAAGITALVDPDRPEVVHAVVEAAVITIRQLGELADLALRPEAHGGRGAGYGAGRASAFRQTAETLERLVEHARTAAS